MPAIMISGPYGSDTEYYYGDDVKDNCWAERLVKSGLQNDWDKEIIGISGSSFGRDLTSMPIPSEILKLVTPEFAIRFEAIPIALNFYGIPDSTCDSDGELVLVTTKKGYVELSGFLEKCVGGFAVGDDFLRKFLQLSNHCRLFVADEKNIRKALTTYYDFSEEKLPKIYNKFYGWRNYNFQNLDDVKNYIKDFRRYPSHKNCSVEVFEGSVNDLNVPQEVLKEIDLDTAVRFYLIPIDLSEGNLTLLTSSPKTIDAFGDFVYWEDNYDDYDYTDELGFPSKDLLKCLPIHTPCKILATTDDNIRTALEKFYNCPIQHERNLNIRDNIWDFFNDGYVVNEIQIDEQLPLDVITKIPLSLVKEHSVYPLAVDSTHETLFFGIYPIEKFDKLEELRDIFSVATGLNCKFVLGNPDILEDSSYYAYFSFFDDENTD